MNGVWPLSYFRCAFCVFWNEAELKKSLTCMVCVRPFFFSDVRFAVFWNEAQLKKSLTCMVCVWPFYFRWAFCVFLKWSRAKEISDMYGLRSAILFQMCVLRFWNQAELKKSLTCMVCVRPFLFQMCVFRFLKWSRAKEISDMYGLRSAIFISDMRFAFFEMKQS